MEIPRGGFSQRRLFEIYCKIVFRKFHLKVLINYIWEKQQPWFPLNRIKSKTQNKKKFLPLNSQDHTQFLKENRNNEKWTKKTLNLRKF